jgi:hypothetical protein
VWDASEYAKLPAYDGEIVEQVTAGGTAAFYCHQQDGSLCAGWLGHRDPYDLFAVRIGVANGALDASVIGYLTDVDLFGSGAEAAAHGLADVADPAARAVEAMRKILTRRRARRAPGEG